MNETLYTQTQLRKLWIVLGVLGMAAALLLLGKQALLVHAATETINTVTSTADGSLVTLAGNSTCDLREAIEAANTDTAVGQCSAGSGADVINVTASGTISLTGGYTVTQNLTLTGPGAASLTIDGNNHYRPFFINSGTTVVIANLTLTKGKTPYELPPPMNGGAVHNQGHLTMNGVTVKGSSAIQYGGGIYNHNGSVLIVQNGSKIGADGALNTADYGGGIYNAGTAEITATVSYNWAESGGGIYNNGGMTIIRHSPIYQNEALDGAGIASIGGNITIEASSITTNTASEMGGGIGADHTAITLTQSTLRNNFAVVTSSQQSLTPQAINATLKLGGGVFLSEGSLFVSEGTFEDNIAADHGGGIYNNFGQVTIQNSDFTGNLATSTGSDHRGGGIYTDNGSLSVTGSTFSGNHASGGTGYGGGIYSHDILTIISSTFSGNEAHSITGYGGGLYVGGTGTVVNSTIYSNTTLEAGQPGSTGGGVYVAFGAAFTLTHSTIVGNSSTSGGGLVNFGSLLLANSIVANNGGNNCSGTITNGGHNLTWPATDTSCPADVTADPRLGAFGNYGGLTWTLPLKPGSPALDAGSCGSLTADQRGSRRPFDLPSYPNAVDGCDIGSYESQGWVFLPLVRR